MDFLSNLIKRPNSIGSSQIGNEAKPKSEPEPEPQLQMESAPSSGSTTASASRKSTSKQIKLVMDRCSIDTDLDNLFVSAAQDLDVLEQQHEQLIDVAPAAVVPPSPRETIKQLLNEINVNLDQVSAREMEHLQAMSLELSPLAVKPTSRSGMERHGAKSLIAALRGDLPPVPNCEPLGEEQSGIKFTGLPEFDEAQIPELAPLSADMEAQLKPNSLAPSLSASTVKLQEPDYNSDSEVFAECLSLNSGKFSADQSELEAFSSALNEVLEEQLSTATATTLEKTLSDVAGDNSHNNSCEPMDVDDINETMEMLKDVLAPEDHQLLQQQFLGEALKLQKAEPKTEKVESKEIMKEIEDEPQEQAHMASEVAPFLPPLPALEDLQSELELRVVEQLTPLIKEAEHLQPRVEEPLLSHKEEEQLQPIVESLALNKEEEQLQEQQQQTLAPMAAHLAALSKSPPIPTHRMKTAEELEEQLALEAYAQPPEQIKEQELQKEPQEQKQREKLSSALEEFGSTSKSAMKAKSCAAVTPIKKQMKPLELVIDDSAHAAGTSPISPTFPIRSPEDSPHHFPRSPRAPPEQDEMPYLEEAIIEPSIDQKLCLAGVIAKSPLPVQFTVTQPSPERVQSELNSTRPMAGASLLNGTFDSASPEVIEAAAVSSKRATFGMPLDAVKDQQRRTFSLHQDAESPKPLDEDDQLNATYGMPLQAAMSQDRRTFSLEEALQEEQPVMEQMDNLHSRRTFCMEQDASPAMEATEENIMAAELEPMDVDVSMRADTTLVTAPSSTPIPTHQAKLGVNLINDQAPPPSPPLPTHQSKERQERSSPPLPAAQLKRPSIHGSQLEAAAGPCPNATVVLEEQPLSVKEQLSASDEKEDVYVEHFGAMSPISDEIFKPPQFTTNTFSHMVRGKSMDGAAALAFGATQRASQAEQFSDAEFQDGASNNNIILNSSDFDYLYTKGSNNAPIDRSSLLLKFDPLLGAPVPVNLSSQQHQEQALLNLLSSNNNQARALSPTLEELETSGSNQSFVIETSAKGPGAEAQKDYKPPVDRSKKHAKMSVDVIDNDCNKTFDNSNLNLEEKAHKYNNMDELEKKIKNEVTRSEDIEKKLKDAEQREEALVKRITEKDKINTKLNGVIEAYEKAIAELIHDKEQLVQNHERQMQEVQTDRDSNYHHLTSLETTFSDLHVKYEKSKEMTSHLKQVEENLLDEKKKLMDKLRAQEQRYEQMKSHAMQQMEIANKKLATLTKEHTDEVKKLKALLKKEEVSRISTAEQLQQKARENADLLKICEELIYDKGQGGTS